MFLSNLVHMSIQVTRRLRMIHPNSLLDFHGGKSLSDALRYILSPAAVSQEGNAFVYCVATGSCVCRR